MIQPLIPLQSRKYQNAKKSPAIQMKMENTIPCAKCDKIFYNAKDLTNHLSNHAAMERKFDFEKSVESMKNTKMQVMMANLKLPIKRKCEKVVGESDPKKFKFQDGEQELSVNCYVEKISCKICKPRKYLKDVEAFRYHMVMTHSVLDDATDTACKPSSNNPLGTHNECITPSKCKVRVKSQASTVEIVDLSEESPNKPVIDQSIIKKLKNLTTTVSLSDLPIPIKNENLSSEESVDSNAKPGKFSNSILQVRMSTRNKKRMPRINSQELRSASPVKSETHKKSVKLTFKEYVTADSESDFEILDRDHIDKNINKNKTTVKVEDKYEKVNNVLIHNKLELPQSTSVISCLLKYPKKTVDKPNHSEASIKFLSNDLKNHVSSVSVEKTNLPSSLSMTPVLKSVNNKAGDITSPEVKKRLKPSEESVADESPRTKSGRKITRSKRLISTDSADITGSGMCRSKEILITAGATYSSTEHSTPGEIGAPLCNGEELTTKAEIAAPCVSNGKPPTSRMLDLPEASPTISSKSKVNSDSDSYHPETQTSDSATAPSDIEFIQPLVRKSSRVRGPKLPQIRDPIENPAPKPKRRLSERKFEGAKPFKCNHCPLSYSNIESKKVHEETHAEKPFQCVYCDMRFNLEFSLKKHMKIHKT